MVAEIEKVALTDAQQMNKSFASGKRNIKELGADIHAIPYGFGRAIGNFLPAIGNTIAGNWGTKGNWGQMGEDWSDFKSGLRQGFTGLGKAFYDAGGAVTDYGRGLFNAAQHAYRKPLKGGMEAQLDKGMGLFQPEPKPIIKKTPPPPTEAPLSSEAPDIAMLTSLMNQIDSQN